MTPFFKIKYYLYIPFKIINYENKIDKKKD